ncbi:hypothetical protein AB0K52_06620 [Glycomyces sp. NPDC049804]|uniref:hypothetical protein n=1 Tax=Glycomyces sp. NPDC049804 TaxID=3154363 RepID=UPI00342BF84E
MDDIGQHDDDPWEDFDDHWSEELPVTYREAVACLQELAEQRSDVRIEWEGRQQYESRHWRSDARVVFVDAGGHQMRLRSAKQLGAFKSVVASGVPLHERHAIWYPPEGMISARLIGNFDEYLQIVVRNLVPKEQRKLELDSPLGRDMAGLLASTGLFEVSTEGPGACSSLRLTTVSPELSHLYRLRGGRRSVPSLELRGVVAADADAAQEILVAYGTSYLTDLARTHGLSLRLWNTGYRVGSRRNHSYSQKARFPKRRYDTEPADLYTAANGPGHLPTERYLYYYQVLEFYMPKAADQEKARQGAAIIGKARSPLPRTGDNRNLSSEQHQLDAVISDAVPPAAAANLLGDRELFATLSDPSIIEHVHALEDNGTGVPIAGLDYREDLSTRVYQIRCRIVHAKEGGGAKGVPPLAPHSREARDLTADLRLIRFLAEKTLNRWATPLP